MIKTLEAILLLATLCVLTQSMPIACAQNAPAKVIEQPDARESVRQFSDHVKVCQVGYLVDETKIAILTSKPDGQALVRRSDNHEIVATLPVGPAVLDSDKGDSTRVIDMTEIANPGRY